MSMKSNIIVDKSSNFSVRIIKLNKYLNSKGEFVISKQILRSGTSIGANVSEAIHAQSRADFLSKMNIALKEASETEYWINVLHKSKIINDKEYQSIYQDILSIKKILISIVKSTKENDKD